VISKENGSETLAELFPLYATHYREMQDRLAAGGIKVSAFNPQIDTYIAQWESGALVNYVVRLDGKAVGYSNVYLARDMHNSDLIAQEDTVFVLKEHRNGTGRKLVQFVLDDLRNRGVVRAHMTAMTDTRAVPLWTRMGFKPAATAMIYTF
jgi:GNAT superfamily N-acetyltransferase